VEVRPARGYQVAREAPNLTERTTEELRQAILQLHLKPGERLVERDLAEQTGTSRTCVRAALQHLRTEGLVERSPRGVLWVASVSLDEARQIYEVRAALEAAMARRFVARAGKAEQAALKAAADDVSNAVRRRDNAGYVAALGAFYDVLLRGSGNEVAHRFLAMLHTRITYLRRITADRATFAREMQTAKLLRGIQRAVAARDADLAAQRCEAFVQRSAEFALQVLGPVSLRGT
jgi:DNA-binding GntR family transcriptional regulator